VIRLIIIKILFFIFIASTTGQKLSKKEIKYRPQNLEEAFLQLDKILPNSIKQQMQVSGPDTILTSLHFGFGMWIRNNWGLWRGKELAKYSNSIGIFHLDDMSAIILRSYYNKLNDQQLELEKQVAYYQDFWKKAYAPEYQNRMKK